jgi:hypothetical protein
MGIGVTCTPPLAALRDPEGVGRILCRQTYGLDSVDVAHREQDCVVLALTLEPWADLAAHDYPTEVVSILITRRGAVLSFPLGPDRPWHHRIWAHLGELCLWYPQDPRWLRWDHDDGLEAYVLIVHRHLQAEEYWRRHGRWPAEDAPHGDGPHPIRNPATRWAATTVCPSRAA